MRSFQIVDLARRQSRSSGDEKRTWDEPSVECAESAASPPMVKPGWSAGRSAHVAMTVTPGIISASKQIVLTRRYRQRSRTDRSAEALGPVRIVCIVYLCRRWHGNVTARTESGRVQCAFADWIATRDSHYPSMRLQKRRAVRPVHIHYARRSISDSVVHACRDNVLENSFAALTRLIRDGLIALRLAHASRRQSATALQIQVLPLLHANAWATSQRSRTFRERMSAGNRGVRAAASGATRSVCEQRAAAQPLSTDVVVAVRSGRRNGLTPRGCYQRRPLKHTSRRRTNANATFCEGNGSDVAHAFDMIKHASDPEPPQPRPDPPPFPRPPDPIDEPPPDIKPVPPPDIRPPAVPPTGPRHERGVQWCAIRPASQIRTRVVSSSQAEIAFRSQVVVRRYKREATREQRSWWRQILVGS